MHIAIDLDDTITHAPAFFAALTNGLTDARVTVITYRTDHESVIETLREHNVRWDRVVLSDDADLGCPAGQSLHRWKVDTVRQLGADVLFDDMPEVVHLVEPPTKAFMCCDDLMRRWLGESLRKRGQ